MVSREYRESVVEVLDILEHSSFEVVSKIPKELLNKFEEIKSSTYKSSIDYTIPLKEQKLKNKTRAIIGMLYRNYLCNPENVKEYEKILLENYNNYNQEINEKYNKNNIFNNKKLNEKNIKINTLPIEKKNISILERIMFFLKNTIGKFFNKH